jgi:hypothetical protein
MLPRFMADAGTLALTPCSIVARIIGKGKGHLRVSTLEPVSHAEIIVALSRTSTPLLILHATTTAPRRSRPTHTSWNMAEVAVALIGPGLVGSAFLAQLSGQVAIQGTAFAVFIWSTRFPHTGQHATEQVRPARDGSSYHVVEVHGVQPQWPPAT